MFVINLHLYSLVLKDADTVLVQETQTVWFVRKRPYIGSLQINHQAQPV